MSSQRELLIVIDEQDPAFAFNGSWIVSHGPWYSFACFYGEGSFTLSFNGSSVAFVGNTPPGDGFSAPFAHTVSIDGGATVDTTFPLADPSNSKIDQGYKQWYTSPKLDNSTLHNSHKITISDTHSVAVDFAIVTIDDLDTPISRDQRILVDDQDPAIHYTGTWRSTTDSQFLAFYPLPGGFPIMNSTHQSQAAGDCLEFRFSGTSIEVYGIWYPPNRDATKVSVRATLDGGLQPLEPIVGRQNERYQNLLIFTASDLLPTDHTFTLTADGTPHLLILDYIVYSPSFTRMRDMPDLSMGYQGCSRAALDDGSSIPIGMIVGVVLGLFACGVLTIIGVWRWNRRRLWRIQLVHSSSPSEEIYALQMPETANNGKKPGVLRTDGDVGTVKVSSVTASAMSGALAVAP